MSKQKASKDYEKNVQPAFEAITKARSNLIMCHPFFGTLALRLRMVPTAQIPTAGVDGRAIFFNPTFVAKLKPSQIQGLIAHEVMHLAFLHHTRRGARDMVKWNMACDYAINAIISEARMDLPEGVLLDDKYNNKTSEDIYNLLPEPPKCAVTIVYLDANSPGGDGDTDEGDGPPKKKGRQFVNVGSCGGVLEDQAATKTELAAEEAEWKIAVTQAAHIAKQQGNLPASLDRLITDLLNPTQPWREILRRFMTERSNDDFNWNRPNRRLISSGLYLPSRYSVETGDVVVVIDTSGSIGEKELNEFGGELNGIIQDLRPRKTYVVYCDASVNSVDEFTPEDPLILRAVGGGGTDFRPPFSWTEDKGIKPQALVYLTDGYGTFPDMEPAFPTLWAISNTEVSPPWGEHLILDFNA